jgi:hypothetical protein
MIVLAIFDILATIVISRFAAYRAWSFNDSAPGEIRYANSVHNLQGSYNPAISKTVDLDTADNKTEYTITYYHLFGDKTYTISGSHWVINGN